MLKWILLPLFPALAFSSAYAQNPLTSYGEWISFGIGASHPPNGLSSNLSYNFERSNTPVQITFDYAGDLALFGGEPDFYSAVLSSSIGQRTFGKYYLLAQFVGASVGYHKKERQIHFGEGAPGKEVVRRISPGLAANAQFYIKPLAFIIPEVGLGVELFGNLNFVRSFYGFRISFLMHNTI